MRRVGRQELEAERAQAAPPRHLDRFKLRASDPQRRMRLLHRLGQDVAHRHFVPLGVEADALVLEHRDDAADRVFPDLALRLHVTAKAAEFGDGGGFAGTRFDTAVGDEIEARDPFGHPLRRVRGKLHDAVTEADVLRPLAGGAEEHFRRGGMRILLEEVVLHFPGVAIAQTIRQLDLVQRVLVKPLLVTRPPRARQLQFVEDAEFHGFSLCYWRVVRRNEGGVSSRATTGRQAGSDAIEIDLRPRATMALLIPWLG